MENIQKLLVLLTIFSLNQISSAQELLSSYGSTYFSNNYNVRITGKSKDKFTLYIETQSLDNHIKSGGISINQKHYTKFINALSDAKLKYQEWINTAKENEITEFEKKMAIDNLVDGFFLSGGNWHFHFWVQLQYEFKIITVDNITKYLLLIRTGKLTSSSNKYTNADDFVLVFSSADEIQLFMDSISSDTISNFMGRTKTQSLFKD